MCIPPCSRPPGIFGQETLGIGRDDILFSAGKLFFAYGLANSMAFPMSVGATTILVPDSGHAAKGDRDDAAESAHGILRADRRSMQRC